MRRTERRFLVRGLLLALAVTLLGIATGCAGTIQTSTGPRPALEMNLQDGAAEVLSVVTPALEAARVKHDSTPVCEQHPELAPPACEGSEIHAKHREVLLAGARGQRAFKAGLLAWKKQTSGFSARDSFCPLARAFPDVATLAVQWGLLKQSDVEKYLPILNAVVGGVCP